MRTADTININPMRMRIMVFMIVVVLDIYDNIVWLLMGLFQNQTFGNGIEEGAGIFGLRMQA